MNGIDISILVITLASAVHGIARGLVRELASLFGFFLGLVVALRAHESAARMLGEDFGGTGLGRTVAFILIALVVWLVAEIAGRIVAKSLDQVKMRWLDRLAGGVFGFLRGLVMVGMMLLLIDLYMPFLQNAVRDSSFAPRTLATFRSIGTVVWHGLEERGGL